MDVNVEGRQVMAFLYSSSLQMRDAQCSMYVCVCVSKDEKKNGCQLNKNRVL